MLEFFMFHIVHSRNVDNYKAAMENTFDTNDLSETTRLDMCAEAMNIDTLSNINFRLSKNSTTDVRRLYILLLEENGPTEVILAFRCPNIPATYLEVHNIHDGSRSMFRVAVIANRKELFPELDEIRFRHQLKDVSGTSKSNVPGTSKSTGKIILVKMA